MKYSLAAKPAPLIYEPVTLSANEDFDAVDDLGSSVAQSQISSLSLHVPTTVETEVYSSLIFPLASSSAVTSTPERPGPIGQLFPMYWSFPADT